MQTHETRNTKPSENKKGGTIFCHVPLTMFSRYDPPILRGSSASILSLFVVWASHSSSSLCSPAQRISTMAPVPKKVLGVCATTKTALKARPSHYKGVSLDWWREERNLHGAARFGGADGLHLSLWPRGRDGAGLFGSGLG